MKNKIIYFIPDLSTNGGIQELAKSIYSELGSRFNFEIFDWSDDLWFPTKVILRRFPRKIGAYLFTHIFSTHFKRKYKITEGTLVHFWVIESAMSFLDKKFVVMCYGKEILSKNVKGYRRELYQKVLDNALLIYADSNYAKKLIIENFKISSRRIKIVYPPISFNKFSQVNKLKNSKLIIGTLTRFVKRKNVPNIIRSLNMVKEKYNLDFTYYLAGNGPEKKKILRELKKAKFEWKYFGEISEHDKINKFYPSLDIFVMPPLELPDDVEGFGIVYLEANAYGIPVVASRTGGVPDAVKEGISGVFADPTNPEDIAIKIVNLLRNKDKYYKSSINWAKEFDVKWIANEFAELYIELGKIKR
jgi:phosphatidylinositol alpha-1,6-mannosyltransferase